MSLFYLFYQEQKGSVDYNQSIAILGLGGGID